jgi:hypothetical protein
LMSRTSPTGLPSLFSHKQDATDARATRRMLGDSP